MLFFSENTQKVPTLYNSIVIRTGKHFNNDDDGNNNRYTSRLYVTNLCWCYRV